MCAPIAPGANHRLKAQKKMHHPVSPLNDLLRERGRRGRLLIVDDQSVSLQVAQLALRGRI